MKQKQSPVELSNLLDELRKFKGITRKSTLGELLPILGENVYDDAGVLEIGGAKVVVSADGIVEGLVRDDPWLAGFYSVVVNVNDVVAKGALPLGYAHVLSSSSSSVRRQIVKGIKEGIEKYGLKFLKGHTHPDTSYDAVDASVIGISHQILLSSANAKPSDTIIVAIDLDGNFGSKSWVKTFDSIMFKTREQVLTRLEAIIQIAERKMARACRDISGPGVLGTVAMLCESSSVGASIIIERIPKPRNIKIQDWLMTYPSTGFVLTTNKPKECIELLEKHGLAAAKIGTTTRERTIQLSHKGRTATFMNFEKESVFGFKKENNVQRTKVEALSEADAPEIEALLRKVWSTACEYPEEWRENRIYTAEQICRDMLEGFHYFGVKVDNKLAGIYKAKITSAGLFGAHQSVDPECRGLGLATAMYNQFMKFAKQNHCEKVCVNTLVNQTATLKILKKMGFRKKGDEYEQAKGMLVQMYEKEV